MVPLTNLYGKHVLVPAFPLPIICAAIFLAPPSLPLEAENVLSPRRWARLNVAVAKFAPEAPTAGRTLHPRKNIHARARFANQYSKLKSDNKFLSKFIISLF